MKKRCVLLVCVGLAIALGLGPAAPAHAGPGNLLRVDLRAPVHPKAYHPSIGDLVECHLEYIVVPGQIVDDLKVAVLSGRSVALVAVVNVPRLPGAGQISVFLAPREEGLTSITITPVVGGKDGRPIKLAFLVAGKAKEAKPKDK